MVCNNIVDHCVALQSIDSVKLSQQKKRFIELASQTTRTLLVHFSYTLEPSCPFRVFSSFLVSSFHSSRIQRCVSIQVGSHSTVNLLIPSRLEIPTSLSPVVTIIPTRLPTHLYTSDSGLYIEVRFYLQFGYHFFSLFLAPPFPLGSIFTLCNLLQLPYTVHYIPYTLYHCIPQDVCSIA